MKKKTNTMLIVTALGIGGYFLYQEMKPSPFPPFPPGTSSYKCVYCGFVSRGDPQEIESHMIQEHGCSEIDIICPLHSYSCTVECK